MAAQTLPTGTITFLFTDIEGSTRLWEQAPDETSRALARHDEIVQGNVISSGGFVHRPRGEGDSQFAVFTRATDAVAAAVLIQQQLFAEPWPTPRPLKVRMALHTGEADLRLGDYYGADVNRCARLRSIAHGDQVLLSAATWILVQDMQPDGVSIRDEGEHRLKDLSRPEHVFQLIIPGLPLEFPPLRSLTVIPNNLPLQLTEFIGREAELKETRRLLEKARLLTLVGPGGIGKSRLALETAARSAESFADGVFFVRLAPLTGAEHIVATIGDSIGFQFSAGSDPRQGLLDYLRHKQLLLVMDNFEHLLAGADMVSDILQYAAQVRILSTSRERLNLSGEAVYMLSGLDYPADPRLPAEEAVQFGAVQLLLERARLVRPGLEVDSPALVQVARICRSVQGMPLALVLAAGWLELLTFEEVAGEIAASLDILESQARDMPDRQRSVRAAFDYSWQRLSTEERQAFSRLAVFRGGFSRRAARQVAGAGLRTLRTLVEKSLITAEGSDRYAVHELLRQFAEEKLEAAGQAGPIRDAHSRYYLEAAAQREADLKGRRQLEALEEVGADLDNVRAAWVWALERRDERAIDQVLESLSLFFYMRSRYQEGWALFQQALQRRVIDHPQLGDSHRVWGRLTARSGLLQSQFAESDPAIEEAIKMSLAIAEANVDQAEIAYSYLALGHYHSRVTGNHQQALNYFEQCLEYYQTLGDLYYVARSLHRVGYSHSHVTGLEEFNHCTRKSLQLARQIGDLSDVAGTLSNLGASSILAGDYVEADGILREAIALSQQIGSRSGLAQSFALLSLHQFVSGKLEEAQETAAKGVAIAKDIAFPLTQAWGLAVLSMRASLDNDYELGRRLAEESLLFITNNNLGVFLGHWAQATAGVGLGQTEQAWQQMLAALEISYRFRWFATMTWPLPAAGIILVQQGHPRRAAEILGLYFNHPLKPSGWAEKWSLLNEWQAQLQESLGVDRYRLAWERGKALDLVTAVEMLLAGGEEAP